MILLSLRNAVFRLRESHFHRTQEATIGLLVFERAGHGFYQKPDECIGYASTEPG